MHDPACQTIPSRGGEAAALVKDCFVAADGYVLVQGDMKTLEIYIAAILSGDQAMISALSQPGVDFHLNTTKLIAMRAWGLTPKQIEDEFAAGDEYHRGIGKTLNFACIAEGELVLTNRGLVPIEQVAGCDLVWDGVEWVHHDGVVFKGIKDVITYEGLTATEDHQVWTARGDCVSFGSAASQGQRLARTGDSAGAVPADFVGAGHEHAAAGGSVSPCGRYVWSLQKDILTLRGRRAPRGDDQLQVPARAAVPRSSGSIVGQTVSGDGAALSTRLPCVESQLQGSRDRMPVRVIGSFHSMGTRDLPRFDLRKAGLRQGGQRRALRAEQPPAGVSLGESAQPKVKARVYDILNAGPRHRFTCSGVLVHNCLFGQGPSAIADSLGIDEFSARTLLSALYSAYPRLKVFIEECTAEARATGYTYAYWDGEVSRRRPVFDAGYSDRGRRGHAERAAFNNRVQSSASDYCLMSLVVLGEFFRANKWPARIVLTVHDSLIVECRHSIVSDVAHKMNEVMCGWPSGPLKLKADFKIGESWGSLEKYKIKA